MGFLELSIPIPNNGEKLKLGKWWDSAKATQAGRIITRITSISPKVLESRARMSFKLFEKQLNIN